LYQYIRALLSPKDAGIYVPDATRPETVAKASSADLKDAHLARLRKRAVSGFRAGGGLRDGCVRVKGRVVKHILSGGVKMTEASRQPKDKNYNLIAVLYQSSDNVESLKTYVQDAEQEGDQELVDFFGGILENNLEAAQRAKEMLGARLQNEQE
jgi:hypothetical protein